MPLFVLYSKIDKKELHNRSYAVFCYKNKPPCRHIVHKTRTKQVGKRPLVSRSLLPHKAGGLQYASGD